MNKIILSVLLLCILNFVNVSAILNGHQAPITPYHTFLRAINTNNLGLDGGGTLISNLHILTVGQLVFNYVRWDIGLGSTNFFQLQTLSSTNSILHPQYVATTRDNNIGIIILPNAITISANVQPIALPTIFRQYPFLNEEGIITGFGITSSPGSRPDILQRAFKRIISDARCQAFVAVQVPNHFCAEDIEFRANICNGDIGGSFTVQIHRREILVGISSINVEACDDTAPSAYLRISHYRQWILQTTGV